MPFKSRKQMRWMYANHPEMAKRWAKHTPNIKDLPEDKVKKRGKKQAKKQDDVMAMMDEKAMQMKKKKAKRGKMPMRPMMPRAGMGMM